MAGPDLNGFVGPTPPSRTLGLLCFALLGVPTISGCARLCLLLSYRFWTLPLSLE